MKFEKGTSGNPSGRPRGIVDKRVRLREQIQEHAEELIGLAIQRAKDGDGMALRLLLDRIVPTLRAGEDREELGCVVIKRTIVHMHRGSGEIKEDG